MITELIAPIVKPLHMTLKRVCNARNVVMNVVSIAIKQTNSCIYKIETDYKSFTKKETVVLIKLTVKIQLMK